MGWRVIVFPINWNLSLISPLGNVAWFSIVRVLPVNVAALSSVMAPVVAMICGAIVYQEPLGLIQGVAMVCCAAGLLRALTKPGQTAKTAA